MTLPAAMRHVLCLATGGPEVLGMAEGPLPAMGAGDVLVRVHAAGVNRPDVLQRAGTYPMPIGTNAILGLEISGDVVAVGSEVGDYTIGDKVCALTNGGGYAEYCAVPAGQVLRIPAALDMVAAAGIPETYFTVWANLFRIGRLAHGQAVLVHGGASGIGSTAIQLAKAFGAKVVTTAGTAAKCAACLRLGADIAIDYSKGDFVDNVLQATSGDGVDIVLDIMGASYFDRNIRCLKQDGRLVIIGFTGGDTVPEFRLGPIIAKRISITGSAMRPRTALEKAEIAHDLHRKVWPLLEAGLCTPLIHEVFPMSRVADAHRMMEAGLHIGKIVLVPD